MAAAKNNQWWMLRAKHGRGKTFETPEILWNSCLEYFEATSKRKWLKIEYKGNPLRKVSIPTDTPFTLSGLYVFLGTNDTTWKRYRNDENYKDFWAVVADVEEIIYTQKFEGAAVGAFNANIIAQSLGLANKTILAGDPENPVMVTDPEKRAEKMAEMAARMKQVIEKEAALELKLKNQN